MEVEGRLSEKALVRRRDTVLGTHTLAVLSRGRAVDVAIPGFPTAELERSWRELQDDLTTLVPAARHTIAERSGHDIYLDELALVVGDPAGGAGARDPGTW